MKSTEDFGEYLQKLIDRHRKDLSILLKDYGVNEDPTPLILMGMMLAHPEFVSHMANLPESRSDGGFLETLAKGMELVNRAKEAGSVLAGTSTTNTAAPAPAPAPTKKWSTKKIIGVGVGVVVVLIIITVIIKKARKKQ